MDLQYNIFVKDLQSTYSSKINHEEGIELQKRIETMRKLFQDKLLKSGTLAGVDSNIEIEPVLQKLKNISDSDLCQGRISSIGGIIGLESLFMMIIFFKGIDILIKEAFIFIFEDLKSRGYSKVSEIPSEIVNTFNLIAADIFTYSFCRCLGITEDTIVNYLNSQYVEKFHQKIASISL